MQILNICSLALSELRTLNACKYPNFSCFALLLPESLAFARAKQDYIQFNLRHVMYKSKPDESVSPWERIANLQYLQWFPSDSLFDTE